MRVIVIGGTGFIGSHLVRRIIDTGLDVVVLSRRPAKVAEVFKRHVIGLGWDGESGDGWGHMVDAGTIIVNLAGAGIADGRWTASRKQQILESRVRAGRAVVDAVERADEKPALVIQGSAVGYYGPQGTDEISDLEERSGKGFLAGVVRDWEQSTSELDHMNVPRAIIRTGIVLGQGGALAKMLTPFKLGLGGVFGSGEQGMSWIHIDDQVGGMLHIMQHKLTGVFNLSAPNPASNRKFTKALGRALSRPTLLSVPGFALKFVLGQLAEEALLSGQYCLPNRLEDSGYTFRYPDLDAALSEVLKETSA